MTPGDRKDLILYRLERAKSTLKEVNLLVENNLLNTAVNRLYYSCYYAVHAILLSHDLAPQTHSGIRHQFGLHFIKTGLIDKELGKYFSDIFDKRQSGDYSDFIEFTESEVLSLISPAKKLITSIEDYLNNNFLNE